MGGENKKKNPTLSKIVFKFCETEKLSGFVILKPIKTNNSPELLQSLQPFLIIFTDKNNINVKNVITLHSP